MHKRPTTTKVFSNVRSKEHPLHRNISLLVPINERATIKYGIVNTNKIESAPRCETMNRKAIKFLVLSFCAKLAPKRFLIAIFTMERHPFNFLLLLDTDT